MKRVAQPAIGITTALIYTRVSSEDQRREGVSLDAQLAACRRYAARPGWTIGREFQDILSGTRDDRRDYQALLAEARRLRAEGRAVAVVVARLDRFGRRLLEQVRAREELKRLGVPTHAVREGGEIPDFVANVLASMAEEEVRRLGARVSETLEHLARTGWKQPGRCPWGYAWRPATVAERAQGAPKVVLDLDPLTAPSVAELFRRVAQGESIRSVIRWVAGLSSSARGGRNLEYGRIRQALSSPTYVARSEHDPNLDILARPTARWPAIVDDQTFRRVQERIAGHRKMPHQASGRYLLTGLLRCPRCGARMTAGGLSSHGHHRYQCNGQNRGSAAPSPMCSSATRMASMDRAVLAEVEPLIAVVASPAAALRARLAQAWKALQCPHGDAAATEREAAALDRAADKARQRMTRATEMYVDGDLTRERYDDLITKAQEDLDAASAELARVRARSVERQAGPALPPLEEVLQSLGGWGAAFSTGDVDAKREVLGLLIETITPRRVRRSVYEAAIAWTPTGALLRELAAAAADVAA